ncbi:hypothetical protein CVT25_001251 [Psilocybe cyanescens]|uniref:Uncharacterized protein n=1 Tax=Psilocybe cyanescens TaxID=93625 RepID=A0A409XB04_PSICY|nr:hypothetical protein CVT25_001251 [Psilocybe cyanescens]
MALLPFSSPEGMPWVEFAQCATLYKTLCELHQVFVEHRRAKTPAPEPETRRYMKRRNEQRVDMIVML